TAYPSRSDPRLASTAHWATNGAMSRSVSRLIQRFMLVLSVEVLEILTARLYHTHKQNVYHKLSKTVIIDKLWPHPPPQFNNPAPPTPPPPSSPSASSGVAPCATPGSPGRCSPSSPS